MSDFPTLRSLAKEAGVHHTTFSRALRNDPKLPEETRARLQALAEKKGYRADALVTRYMTALQRGKSNGSLESIGLLTSVTRMGEGNEPFQAFCQTISRRAGELGYRIEELWMNEPEMTTARMNKIIRARGIEGLIIPPNFATGGSHLSLDLSNLAVVLHHHAVWRPQLHRVESNDFQNMLTVMKALRRKKYRRIGLVLLMDLSRATGHEREGAYHYYHAMHSDLMKLANPTFCCKGFDDEGLLKWVKAEKPDVVVGVMPDHADFFRSHGIRVPEDLGCVATSVNSWDPPTAGIDMRAEDIDRAAVDVVVAQINRNEKGVPKIPRQIVVEGVWRDGPTVRK